MAVSSLAQVTPLLLGSAQTPYAQELRGRFRAAAPMGGVEERFLGPDSIAGIYARTRLNFHPCLYDAFGMTVIEAASQGAPLSGPWHSADSTWSHRCHKTRTLVQAALKRNTAPRVPCKTQPGNCRMRRQGRPL